jgi:hypothetical protein
MRFEILTVVKLSMLIFWVIMLPGLVCVPVYVCVCVYIYIYRL